VSARDREVQRTRRRCRAGYTLAEMTVAAACLSLLLLLSTRVLAEVASAATGLQERGSWLQAARTARWVLRSELGSGEAGRDWLLLAPDSVGLRAFRGLALVCSAPSDSTFVVRVRSARIPDPGKDSVLALREDGRWVVGRLASTASASSGCPDPTAGRSEVWRIEGFPETAGRGGVPVMLRLFESGSYHVGGATLRYRRGGGGAQPLTEPVLRGARLVEDTAAGLAAGFQIDGPAAAGSAWSLPLARVP